MENDAECSMKGPSSPPAAASPTFFGGTGPEGGKGGEGGVPGDSPPPASPPSPPLPPFPGQPSKNVVMPRERHDLSPGPASPPPWGTPARTTGGQPGLHSGSFRDRPAPAPAELKGRNPMFRQGNHPAGNGLDRPNRSEGITPSIHHSQAAPRNGVRCH